MENLYDYSLTINKKRQKQSLKKLWKWIYFQERKKVNHSSSTTEDSGMNSFTIKLAQMKEIASKVFPRLVISFTLFWALFLPSTQCAKCLLSSQNRDPSFAFSLAFHHPHLSPTRHRQDIQKSRQSLKDREFIFLV